LGVPENLVYLLLFAIILLLAATIYLSIRIYRIKKTVGQLGNLLDSYTKGQALFDRIEEDVERMMPSVKNLQKYLQNIIYHILKNSAEIAAGSANINSSSRKLEENIKDLNQILSGFLKNVMDINDRIVNSAAISEELYGSINEIASFSSKALDTSKNAASDLDLSLKSIEDAVSIIEEQGKEIFFISKEIMGLKDLLSKISSVSDNINEISSQINLLSLNASIEAARAGSAGKGFAVVAEEIKKLADETSKFSKEIVNLVKDIQNYIQKSANILEQSLKKVDRQKSVTDDAKKSLSNITNVMSGIEEIIKNISENIASQTQATEQMAENIQDVSNFSSVIADSIKNVEEILHKQKLYIGENFSQIKNLTTSVENFEIFTKEFDSILGDKLLEIAREVAERLTRESFSLERMPEIVKSYGVTEICITDEDGVVVLDNDKQSLNFRFPEDETTQAGEFRKILKGKADKVVQKIQPRNVDGRLYKFVGVKRKDRPGIVQVALSIEDIFRLTSK